MGLADLAPSDDDDEEEEPIDPIERIQEELEEEEPDLETFHLPLLVEVEIKAENFAQAVKQLRDRHEPRLSGLMLRRLDYMEVKIPEDINDHRDN